MGTTQLFKKEHKHRGGGREREIKRERERQREIDRERDTERERDTVYIFFMPCNCYKGHQLAQIELLINQ